MKTNAHVYVLQAQDGTIKVGHSKVPDVRRRQIELELRKPLKIIHMTDVIVEVERVERLAHRLLALAKLRVGEKGEWFSATLPDALAAIDMAISILSGEAIEPVWPKRFTDRVPLKSGLCSIRLDPELKADLQAMADDDDRSFSYIVEKLLRNSVSEWKAKRKQARKC
jgi:signal transduction histidine kinase